MDSKLLEFYTNMRVVRKKLKELQEQYEFCGIVFLDVNSETFLFTGQKLRELFENPNSRILQSCNIRRINDFIRNLYETEETKEYFNPCNITNIKVEDEQGSYWVQLYAWKWKFTRGRSLAGIIWIKLEEKKQAQGPFLSGNCRIHKIQIPDRYREETLDNYLFAWNILDDRVLLSKNWSDKFSARNSYKRLNGQLIEWYMVKEDISKFHKLQNDIKEGKIPEDILLRFHVRNEKQDYEWCRISFLSILCDDKMPIYVIGQVQDIDERNGNLCSKDGSFYTSDRKTMRQRMNEIFADEVSEEIHGFLAVRLNIKEAAKNAEIFWEESAISYSFVKKLSFIFGPGDILLVHDDILVIVMKDMESEAGVSGKAALIHKAFECMGPDNLYAEMGLSLWPRDGRTFEELLISAEKNMDIKISCSGSELTEGPDNSGDGEPEEETARRLGNWPVSVVSDIMDDWYHMIYMNSRLKRQMELVEAQIMLGQIKPHFVFNALANIKALMHTDTDMSERLIIAFTKYLRAHLDAWGKEEMIPLREILEFVDNYIQVEQSRFPGKFEVDYDIQYENFHMPHFIIQPLVENAIKHGLCKKNGTGKLRIASYRADGEICIEIEDDGIGFNQMPEPTMDGGMGIENVRKRLAYLLDGSLVLNSELGKGTKAVIRFRGYRNEDQGNYRRG
ncbi:MAG: histidine kinase [Clostridium sp.]|nr:histidine kinase [Clostridium sp.]